MKKMMKKIKNRAGETIGETLAALLIASLALIMLAAAISTSTGIISKSSERIDAYFEKSNDELVKMTNSKTIKCDSVTDKEKAELKEKGSMIKISLPDIEYAMAELKTGEPVISFKVKEDD